MTDVFDQIAADGTDPELLGRVLAWSCRPRRHLDQLRRTIRDEGCSTALSVAAATLSELVGNPPSAERQIARRVAGVWEQQAVRVVLIGDAGYPPRLSEGWPDTPAPLMLAVRGSMVDDAPGVAIVGARRASSYGRHVAAWIAEAVASAGGRVVSGGAVGVDESAHRASMDQPGGTTVVLGCGHAVPYPAQHARPGGLFDQVVDAAGTVLSECLPHEPPRAAVIRARNRIVAGLADVVVVVEGGPRSGALLTAGAAAEWSRDVLAVPGDIRAVGSQAPHRLLGEGAAPCTGPEDVLERLAPALAERAGPNGQPAPPIGSPHEEITGSGDHGSPQRLRLAAILGARVACELEASWPRAIAIEQLAATTQEPVAKLIASITRARMAGLVTDSDEGISLCRSVMS